MVAATKEDAKTLYEKMVKQGASEKQASKFSGYTPEPKKPSAETKNIAKGAFKAGQQSKSSPAPANGNGKSVGGNKTQPVPKAGAGLPRIPFTTSKAQKTIFGVMIGITVLTIAGDVMSGRSKQTDAIPRRITAGTIAGIMLMILAIPAPKVAAALTWLAAISWLLFNPDSKALLQKFTGTAINRNATVVATNTARDEAIHSGPGGPEKRRA